MRKKILCLVLCMIMSFAVLTGCNLFEHNYEKDYMQVVAVIDPIEETINEGTENEITFESERKLIYKHELISSLNSNGQDLMANNNYTAKEAVTELLQNEIDKRLVIIEAQRLIKFGEIIWRDGSDDAIVKDKEGNNKVDVGGNVIRDYADENRIKGLIYDAIDSTIASIKTEIYTERGLKIPTVENSSNTAASTKYPIQPAEANPDEDEELVEEKPLELSKGRWPGFYGEPEQKSIERECMRRFIALLSERVSNNYTISNADKKEFKKDDAAIQKVIDEQGIEYVYPMLIETHYIEYLLGKSAREQVLSERLQNYLTKNVTVSDAEIRSRFDVVINSQVRSYNASIAAYNTAMQDSETTVYYHPISNYFYVKHILVPFSETQSASLAAFKTKAGWTQPEYLEFRDRLANAITAYPRLNGEDDMTKSPIGIAEIFRDVKNTMASFENNALEANREFDKLVYKYNTDGGMFGNTQGYNVRAKINTATDAAERYMTEFSTAARELYDKYEPGKVLPTFAVTDYGVHIMFFAKRVEVGEVTVDDFVDASHTTTYGENLKETLKTAKENDQFNTWKESRISYYKEIGKYKTITKRFKDLYS